MKTWLITGVSRGLGREWAEAALERGDKVAGTVRNLDTVKQLAETHGDRFLALNPDITDKAAVDATVAQTVKHFGGLDVVVNNAGYGLFGAIEEISEQEAREQIDVNFFGTLWFIQAALPVFRTQGSGHFIQVSSIGGITAGTYLGLYHASKWAVEAISQSLAAETASFGVKVTVIEPTRYATDWSGSSAVYAQPIDAYLPFRMARVTSKKPAGDPRATREAILKVVDSDNPPLRLFLGTDMIETARAEYEKRLAVWESWREVSEAAMGEPIIPA